MIQPRRSATSNMTRVQKNAVNRLIKQAQNQRDGKALHLVGADIEEHDAGDDRREVSIDNRDHRAAETIANGHSQCGAAFELFANALVDEHVRIDRHTDRQRQTGEAGQCERAP